MNNSTTPRHSGAVRTSGGSQPPLRLSEGKSVIGRGSGFRVGLALMSFFIAGRIQAESSAQSRWETLQAIHMIENPDNSTKVGRRGELGPYQFRPSTWRMHTQQPFHLAVDREVSDQVAVKHYEWIRRNLERGGIAPTPYRIALAWNAGLDAVLRGAAPSRSHHYATRVEAIAVEMQKKALASEP